MDDFAKLSPDDRTDLFRAVGDKRGIGPELIEKDFWVCWTLKRMFHTKGMPSVLFKGGTSLSKVYHAIQRFSEDIDLSLDRATLGFGGSDDPSKATSGKQRKKRLDALTEACRVTVRETVLPVLLAEIEKLLPARSQWMLAPADDDQEQLTLAFAYPSSFSEVASYVRRQIRLEFGARSDHWPAAEADVSSYAAEDFPLAFKLPNARVRALAAERTFWEKATALHAWHSNPASVVAERRSRHYYDLACLYEGEIGKRALADHKLLHDVAAHKATFFSASSAHYELAKPGTLALLPPEAQLRSLRVDYAGTTEMIFGKAPTFDHILEVLTQINTAINT